MAGTAPDMLKLKSSQGEIFEVEPEVACMSTLIKNMVDDSGTDEEIPLPNVKTAILSKVLDYCKHHRSSPPEEIQKPLKSTNLIECGVSDYDSEYVNIEQETLFELILAANYLDIKSLLDLTCAKVAAMIKGKTPEEIRKQFNIVNDFTPEEEAQVLFLNRPDPEPLDGDWRYAEHFKQKSRRYEFRLQGTFTADPGTGEDVFFGIELPGRLGLSWALRATAESVLRIVRSLCADRGIGYSYSLELLEGENGDVVLPYLAFPLVAADAIVVTPPGEKAPRLTEALEPVSLEGKAAVRLNTRDTFTFTYWSKQADFERWELTNMPPLGWSASLCAFIGRLPVQFCCYRLRG